MGLPPESKDLEAVETAPSDEQTETHFTHPHYRSTYAIMFGFLLLGLLAAIGHHCFYLYLDTLEIDGAPLPQKWVIRVGNAFAFLFKLSLAAAIAISYSQGFWYFVRRKSFQISSLNAMFGVLYNPVLFLNPSLLRKTSLLFGLALVSWLLPISAVFSPGTLTGSFHCISAYVK
jgi:hypothetical protein